MRWGLLLLLLGGCARTAPCSDVCAAHPDPWSDSTANVWHHPGGELLPHDALVRFDHGGFLEGCPRWSFTVFADGRVEYEGLEHVRVRAQRSRQLHAEDLGDLRALLAELPTRNYDRDFMTHSGWGSVPCSFGRTVEYRTDDGELLTFRHTIDGDHYAPACLRHLEYRIVERAGVKRWTGGDPFGDVPLPFVLQSIPEPRLGEVLMR